MIRLVSLIVHVDTDYRLLGDGECEGKEIRRGKER